MSPRMPAIDSHTPGQSALRHEEADKHEEQQLLEACELMLLQRCFRELLLEEFVTTLHLVGNRRLHAACQEACHMQRAVVMSCLTISMISRRVSACAGM